MRKKIDTFDVHIIPYCMHCNMRLLNFCQKCMKKSNNKHLPLLLLLLTFSQSDIFTNNTHTQLFQCDTSKSRLLR